ncbi:peptidoglycan D,D-transpeptidase FtsI family protein [Kineosporia succinea]|uniref:Peptidoglycan glycosyltransferase n=1 Tax=Kineosporia succinea TaxID=84632 RepID=A0ABT9P0V7_9ACTN|nr:penicillin-binding protein 2 [Kineosporia succinea]MDP9826309.1 peptidoglycan glycosyltransferase [Kineosporia succinea]
MNGPIRRLAAVITLLFTSLFVSVTYIQVINAQALNDNPRNSRTLIKERSRERGEIKVGNKAVATSEPVDDEFKFLRKYSNGALYAPVTGFYSLVNGNPYGIESAESEYLSGTSDELFIRNLSSLLTGEQAQGATVETTINAKAQKAAYDALGDQDGAVIALDPETGDILTMVSKPSYNPNKLASHDTTEANQLYLKLAADDLDPLINRTIGQLYAPGSTFKIVTSAAALTDGRYGADSESGLTGVARLDLPETTATLPNDTGTVCADGTPTLREALEESCNTTYGQLGMDLGQEAMSEQAAKFGFGQSLTVPQNVVKSSFPTGLNQPQLAQSSIGQFDVRATPLQVAMLSAGVENGGVVMRPNLVSKITSADGKTISEPTPEKFSEAVTSDVADQLKSMMVSVVQNGTGKPAQISGVTVGGKTGTAQQQTGQNPDVWFTCFGEKDGKKIAVAVVVEDGGRAGSEAFGSTVAAPIAKAVMEAVLT